MHRKGTQFVSLTQMWPCCSEGNVNVLGVRFKRFFTTIIHVCTCMCPFLIGFKLSSGHFHESYQEGTNTNKQTKKPTRRL